MSSRSFVVSVTSSATPEDASNWRVTERWVGDNIFEMVIQCIRYGSNDLVRRLGISNKHLRRIVKYTLCRCRSAYCALTAIMLLSSTKFIRSLKQTRFKRDTSLGDEPVQREFIAIGVGDFAWGNRVRFGSRSKATVSSVTDELSL